ncbi:MAG: LCP family protein [Lachnospiraceae bacterium]|nr:LCP family protein [Lachnospiraceae bacterium]
MSEKKKLNKGQKTSRNIIILVCTLLTIIIAVVIVGYFLINGYAHKFNYIADEDVIATMPTEDPTQGTDPEEVISKIIDAFDVQYDPNEESSSYSPEELEKMAAEVSKQAEENAKALENVEVKSNANVQNILLIGIDTRAGSSWNGLSDSMILCSINNDKKTITLTSFMRDLCVNIPGKGTAKLNAAHGKGAGPLLVQTIEENFKIHIDYYATVNFYNMINIIDALGGVDIDVTDEEANVMAIYIKQMCQGIGLDPTPYYVTTTGHIHLNGMQAVAYARNRYTKGWDYKRTERQRIILTAMFAKLQASDLGTINSFLNAALPNITTNMPGDIVMYFVNNASLYLGYGFQAGYRVPFDDIGWTSLNSMLITDLAATHNRLMSILY